DITLGELMSLFESAAHSRLVVYNETLDDPEGMVHIRDLLAFMTARARVTEAGKTRRKKALAAGLDLRAVDLALPLSEANIIRKLLYVPPSMRAIDLLAQMQASRIHLALVVDEYGGTDGLVSMEDIVEQIVGEIDDEHDSDEPPAIVRQADNSFIADARASLDDVRYRPGVDGGHRRADRRRDRRRARQRRAAGDRAAGRQFLHRRRPRQPRRRPISAWCRWRTSSSRSSARSTTSTTATSRRRSCGRPTIPSSPTPAPASTTS